MSYGYLLQVEFDPDRLNAPEPTSDEIEREWTKHSLEPLSESIRLHIAHTLKVQWVSQNKAKLLGNFETVDSKEMNESRPWRAMLEISLSDPSFPDFLSDYYSSQKFSSSKVALFRVLEIPQEQRSQLSDYEQQQLERFRQVLEALAVFDLHFRFEFID